MDYNGDFDSKTVLITGGGGYVGSLLAQKLLQANVSEIRLADIAFTNTLCKQLEGQERVSRRHSDIRNPSGMSELFKDVDIVFHLASYGMSGSSQLQKPLVRTINVGGSQNVINACREAGVTSLVYASTYNVVFAGQTIVNGQLNLPYVEDDQHVDMYSRTKTEAEQLMMQAHGSQCKGGGRLNVIAIRPNAIYGEHETRHLYRIISLLNSGLDFFAVGSKELLTDWVHGENLTHGLLVAGQACLASDADKCGRSYPISDGAPINNFVFLNKLLKLDQAFWINIPTSVMFAMATVTEWIHAVVGRVYPFEPVLTRAEVVKVGYTHFMDMDAVATSLGYKPILSQNQAIQATSAVFAPLVKPARVRQWHFVQRLLTFLLILMFFYFYGFAH